MMDPIFASAKALARAIRSREVSSLEVVSAYLKRIDEVNPLLNAVVQLTADDALRQARQADAALARKDSTIGPLHGIPVSVKDSFETAGVISTAGTLGHASFVPAKDATAVARLRAAGAILQGKTNTLNHARSYSLTVWPSLVLRGGTSSEGLPIGIQAVARPWREDVALAAGMYLESILGGCQRPTL